MKMVQYNEYFNSNVDTYGLVLKHQAISSHSAQNTPMHFQLSLGQTTEYVISPIEILSSQKWEMLTTMAVSWDPSYWHYFHQILKMTKIGMTLF